MRVTERVPGRPDKPTIRRVYAGSTTLGGTLQLLRHNSPRRIFPIGRKRTLETWTMVRPVRDGARGPCDRLEPRGARLPDQDPDVQLHGGEDPRPEQAPFGRIILNS